MRLVILAAAAAIPLDVSAYPIPPQTVWDLAREADVVVLAQVTVGGETPP